MTARPTAPVIRAPIGTVAWRIVRFGLVGLLATGVHFSVAVTALRVFGVVPELANATGFATAFGLSFLGHAFFTFRVPVTADAAVRFTLVNLTTLALGSTLVAWLSRATNLPGPWVLAIGALFSAGTNFLGHSLWSFGRRRS